MMKKMGIFLLAILGGAILAYNLSEFVWKGCYEQIINSRDWKHYDGTGCHADFLSGSFTISGDTLYRLHKDSIMSYAMVVKVTRRRLHDYRYFLYLESFDRTKWCSYIDI